MEVRAAERGAGRDAHAGRQRSDALLELVVGLGEGGDGHLRVELRAELHLEAEGVAIKVVGRLRAGEPLRVAIGAVPGGEEVGLRPPSGTFLG